MITLPILQTCTLSVREVFPEPLVPPLKKEVFLKASVGTTSLLLPYGHFVKAPILILHHGDHREICKIQTENLTVRERVREGLPIVSAWILDWLQSCSSQAVIPISGFAHLQNQVWGTQLCRVQICLIWILKWQVLQALESSLPTHGKVEVTASPKRRMSFGPFWPEVQPSSTGTERQVGRIDLPQSKASTEHGGFSCFSEAGGLIYSQG